MPREYNFQKGQHDLAPHIPERTQYFELGEVTVGVEPRVISEGMNAAYKDVTFVELDTMRELMNKFEEGGDTVLTSGVSLHVFGTDDDELVEYLRFDCFSVRPHYHYYSMSSDMPPIPHAIDSVAQGEPLTWALSRIEGRLQEMLHRAGAHDLAGKVNQADVDAGMIELRRAAEDALASSPPIGAS